MTDQQPEHLGRLDDEAEAAEPSSTTDGAAAAGEYDPRQGSPDSGTHPVFTEMTRGTLGSEVSDEDEAPDKTPDEAP